MNKTLLLSLLLLLHLSFQAQTSVAQAQTFAISGTVANAKGEKLEAATAFIGNSQIATVTDKDGGFRISGLTPGTYQLIVNLLGYSSVKQEVVIKESSEVVNLVMPEKSITLKGVSIGDESKRKNFLKTFTKYFLGESDNAKACVLVNPEVLDFSTNKSLMEATAEDFLIIENSGLGYRIKYLLTNFKYENTNNVTTYDGEAFFEPMKGTEVQQAEWTANREKIYKGSFMHYLRALFTNTTREEGFLTYAVKNQFFPMVADPNPVTTSQVIQRIDSNFISVTYKKRLYTIYDPKQAAKEYKLMKGEKIVEELDRTGSVLLIKAEIDARGRYSENQNILLQGFWSKQRIGDQLPFEYDPIAKQ